MDMVRYVILGLVTTVVWMSTWLSVWAMDVSWKQIWPEVASAPLIHHPPSAGTPASGPVVVTFFASWCPPCTTEFNHLNSIHETLASSGATIIGINLHEDFGGKKNPERMQRFLKRTQPKFALYRGNPTIAALFGGVPRIPTVVLFDRAGNEAWRFVHERGAKKTHATADDILQALSRLRQSDS